MDAKLTKLFDAYEKAYSALDFETSAGFFADTFISAGPRGTIDQSKSEFKSWAITYIIDQTGPEPKIVMFISHEDEEEAMKTLGLL